MKPAFNLNRRTFLISSVVGGGLLYLATKYRLSFEHNNKMLAATSGSPITSSVYEVAESNGKESLFTCHIATGRIQSIDVPLRGHQVCQHPFEKNLLFTSEKWGVKAALVDLKTEKVLTLMKSDEGTRFFGHSVFSADGKYVISSELDDRIGESYLGVRDFRSLKLIKRIPTHGIFAHQIISPDQGNTVMVINAGAFVESYTEHAPHWKNSPFMHHESTLNLIDLSTDKLLKSSSLARSGFAHFAYDKSDGSAVAIGNAKPIGNPSLISILKEDGSVIDLRKTQGLDSVGEALSVDLDTKNKIAYVTIPERSLLLKVDYRTNQILDRTSLNYTRGVAMDGDTLYISSPNFARTTVSSSPMKNWAWKQWELAEPSHGSHLAILDSYLRS